MNTPIVPPALPALFSRCSPRTGARAAARAFDGALACATAWGAAMALFDGEGRA
jgi:hypothetical protein